MKFNEGLGIVGSLVTLGSGLYQMSARRYIAETNTKIEAFGGEPVAVYDWQSWVPEAFVGVGVFGLGAMLVLMALARTRSYTRIS